MPAAKPQKKRMNLTKACDTLFSKIIRARGCCEINHVTKCPSGPLQCCHIFSRSYRAVRFDERNAVAGCAGCHLFFTLNPEEWDDWRVEHLGIGLYEELRAKAMAGGRSDLAEVKAALEARLAEVSA